MAEDNILDEFFVGMNYPLDLWEMLEHARSLGLDRAVVDMLAKLPDRVYDGAADLSRAIGDIE